MIRIRYFCAGKWKTDMKYLLSLLTAFTLTASAQDVPTTESYIVNFDRNTVRTHSRRQLTAISIDGNALAFTDPSRMYADLTPQMLTVQPGHTLFPSVSFTGSWMQTYIYVDFNRNGQFDVETPGPQGQLQGGNELVCFSGMTLSGGNYDSAGNPLSDLSGVQPPAFTIPKDVEPGIYMMRWKIDWDNCDPAGRMDEANSIIQNGGAIADVLLCVTNDPAAGSYRLVFSDEFNLPDGSRPDPAKWRVSTRSQSVWNRWISDSPEVAFIEDGHLVCRAIPNPDTSVDDVPMLTGSIETRDLYSFTYGKVEVRLRTAPYAGNFPAAWMMPQPPCAVWPNAGEIDIFEAIDAQNTSYHTIHSHWSFDLGNKTYPQSSFTKSVAVGKWHIYGVEWLEDRLIFTVDNVVAGTYARSDDESILEQGQWPFTHPFYLILNQSVGNGSWAKEAETSHTYETRFDYVRVYQKDGVDGISERRFNRLSDDDAWYDLMGRQIDKHHLTRGIYLHNGRKVLIK